MNGIFIGALLVALIVVVVIYLFYTAGAFGKVKKIVTKLRDSIGPEEPTLVDKPSIYYRLDASSSKRYMEMEMDKPKFTIGSGSNNDLVLDSATVETRHAEIYKRVERTTGREYFELINCAKTNPTKYYDESKSKKVPMGVKDSVELSQREAFFIGEYKVQTRLPEEKACPKPTVNINQPAGEAEPVKDKKVYEDLPVDNAAVQRKKIAKTF